MLEQALDRQVPLSGVIAKEQMFESCPFNTYTGPPEPELLIITSSICSLYSREAVTILGLEKRVGVLKLATTWPLPPKLLTKHLASTKKVLFVEEVAPTLENHVKVIAAESMSEIGAKTFYGKKSGHVPSVGELNPDIVISALSRLCGVPHQPVTPDFARDAKLLADRYSPARGISFCPGCPHRTSFWSITSALQLDARQGFVCGDIGCYALAAFPTGSIAHPNQSRHMRRGGRRRRASIHPHPFDRGTVPHSQIAERGGSSLPIPRDAPP